jgi:hypothetical protein
MNDEKSLRCSFDFRFAFASRFLFINLADASADTPGFLDSFSVVHQSPLFGICLDLTMPQIAYYCVALICSRSFERGLEQNLEDVVSLFRVFRLNVLPLLFLSRSAHETHLCDLLSLLRHLNQHLNHGTPFPHLDRERFLHRSFFYVRIGRG